MRENCWNMCGRSKLSVFDAASCCLAVSRPRPPAGSWHVNRRQEVSTWPFWVGPGPKLSALGLPAAGLHAQPRSSCRFIDVYLPLQRATGRWQEDCHYVSFDTQGHRRDMPEYRSAIGAMVCAVGLVCFAQTVRAQSRPGKITGVVTDPAGAVVPNARVTISGPDGFSEEAPSDAQGRFAAAGLVPGEYRLEAAADGFVSYQSADLRIRAGDSRCLWLRSGSDGVAANLAGPGLAGSGRHCRLSATLRR